MVEEVGGINPFLISAWSAFHRGGLPDKKDIQPEFDHKGKT
jgi:hypothetical protein